jgi:hypothetical protein
VKRASARADELHAASVAKPDAPVDAPQPAPEPAPQPAPEPAPTPAPAPDAPAPSPSNNEPVNWEHRYNSMKGRYERERAEKLAISEQLANTQALLAARPSTPAPAEVPAELRPESLLPPEVVNEYGEEFLGVVGKKAKAELTPEITALKQQLANLQKQLEGSATADKTRARQAMHAMLDDKIPNWQQINVAPEFHSWLALPDEFSGAIRHELLKAAYEQNDTPRVLAFFRRFISDEAALDPAITHRGNEPEPTDAQSGKIPLAELAAPGRAKTAAAGSAPVEKPTFTHAQIATFYTDCANGKYRGRDEERSRIEKQIFDAQREGRIR